MPWDSNSSEVTALSSPNTILKIESNNFDIYNVMSVIIHVLNRRVTITINDFPQRVEHISIAKNSVQKDNNNRFSNMSPNPEHIHFHNEFHQQQEIPDDDEVDSGFGSGGTKHSEVFSSRLDHEVLMANENELSVCGFYYPNVDSVKAMKMLKNSSVGTFLIRNSLNPRFLFSLSVKTQRGATSVRIAYQEGWFSFDCDERIRKRMLYFNSVLELIDHHVGLSRQGINNSWRWEEKSGRKKMVVDISKPCRTSVPSLRHLSTIAVNRSTELLVNHILHEHESILKCYPYKV